MAGITHFLRPEGWKITRVDGLAAKILPAKGSTIMIGLQDGALCQVYRLALVDQSKAIRVLDGFWFQNNRLELPIRLSGREYLLTVEANGNDQLKGGLELRSPAKAAAALRSRPEPTGQSGTWGAEANPGG
ncbi:MAG TPA: hypothetical protein VN493_12510 [Thermoanaerobaculia bacterium]|nr:hypothetical protein [Thermoanaerobaculia bacterium]